MTVVLCADDRGGLSFNGRRQSQDRALRADLLSHAQDRLLWMDSRSRGQFTQPEDCIRESDAPWLQAGGEDLCFLELQDPSPALERADTLVVYRWNRHYPSDRRITLPPAGWHLVSRKDFPGHSHDVITKEIYQR